MGVELGRLVQQRRHELGLSRRDLADRSEISYPYISQIETGERDPSLRTMHKLADTLDIAVERLASTVSPDDWVSMPSMTDPVRHQRAEPTGSLELYREKVLPAVQRRLASVPPLVRLQLLAELTAQAAAEAGEPTQTT